MKLLDSLVVWWKGHNDPTCRECGLGYQEAKDMIKDYDRLEVQLIQEKAEKLVVVMAHHELLTMLDKHFVLLQRLAASPGPVKQDDKIVSKYRVIAEECEAARKQIQNHLGIRE